MPKGTVGSSPMHSAIKYSRKDYMDIRDVRELLSQMEVYFIIQLLVSGILIPVSALVDNKITKFLAIITSFSATVLGISCIALWFIGRSML